MFKKISAAFTILMGVLVIALGIACTTAASNTHTYSDGFSYHATQYDVDSASFGADFYTYMYKATDTIVSELNAMNIGLEDVIDAQDIMNKNLIANVYATDRLSATVAETGGILIVSIGLGLLCYGFSRIADAFASEKNTEKKNSSRNSTEDLPNL